MSAKVRQIRGAWWVVTHFQGGRRKKRLGPTKAHKRQAEEIARKINGAIALGTFAVEEPERVALPFSEYAESWLWREVQLPTERNLEGALAPSTGELHTRHVRSYLKPFLGDRDLREIGVGDVQSLVDRCIAEGKPPSLRSIEMIVATMGAIFKQAEAREEVMRNPVNAWKQSRGRRRRSSGYRIDPENVLDSGELARFLSAARDTFPDHYPLILLLADTGARVGEATALRWIDVDLDGGAARITRSFSDGRHLGATKSGKSRTVELSARLTEALQGIRPDLFGDETLLFPSETGTFLNPHNFRRRVFSKIVAKALGRARRFTPHGLRHTFASLHLARGTNLKWVQAQGGWASAKVLLDWYGHYLPTETTGYADALSDVPGRPYTAPPGGGRRGSSQLEAKTRGGRRSSVAPRGGLEPPTRCLEGSCSILLSYRGARRRVPPGCGAPNLPRAEPG